MTQTLNFWRGYNPPFFGGQYSVLSPQYDERLIKNDLLLMLNTLPGERRNRPGYGCLLRSMLFEPANDDFASDLRTVVVSAIQRFEKRVTLRSVVVRWSKIEKSYQIDLAFIINNNPSQPLLIELKFTNNGISNV